MTTPRDPRRTRIAELQAERIEEMAGNSWVRADVLERIKEGWLEALADYGKVSAQADRHAAKLVKNFAKHVPKTTVAILEAMDAAKLPEPEKHLGRLMFCASTGFGMSARNTPCLSVVGLHLTLHYAVLDYIGRYRVTKNRRGWAVLHLKHKDEP